MKSTVEENAAIVVDKEGSVKYVEENTAIVVDQEQSVKHKEDFSLWGQIKKNKASYLLMAPFMLLFFAFTVLPVISSIVLSFTYFNMLEFPEWRGWLNYVRLFLEDDVFLIVLKNTLIIVFITGPVSFVLSFLLAWFINEFRPRVRAILTTIFYAPTLSGTAYVIWSFIFSNDQYGIVNGFLMKWGIVSEPVRWLIDEKYTLGIVIVVQLWLSLGAGFLAFIAGLQSVNGELYEAGSIDGIRNRWQELIYITIPSMAPQLMFGAVLQIGVSFGVCDVVKSLVGFPTTGYSADTIVTYINDIANVRFEMGYASAIAVVLFGAMLLTNKLITSLLSKYSYE